MDRSHKHRLAAPARLALSALALGMFASCTEVAPAPTTAQDTTLSSAADPPLATGPSRIAEQPGQEVVRTRKACVDLADIEFGTIAYLDTIKVLPPGAQPSGPDPCLENSYLRAPPPRDLRYEFGCRFTGADGVVYEVTNNTIVGKTLAVAGQPATSLPLGLTPSDKIGDVQSHFARRGLDPGKEIENGETHLSLSFCDKEAMSWPVFVFNGDGRFDRIEIQALL